MGNEVCFRKSSDSFITSRVQMHEGKPALFINNVLTAPVIYSLTQMPGGRWSWEELPKWNINNFVEQGFRLIQVHIWFDHIWKQDGTLDIDFARKQIAGVIDICKDAAVFIRLHVTPPYWWILQNIDECTQYADGPLGEEDLRGLEVFGSHDLDRVPRPSMASLKWREETSKKIREFCAQLACTYEGGRVAAIHIASGVYHEWHYWGFIHHEPDVSVSMTHEFRRWLTLKYSTDEALKKAWNNPEASLETACVPGMQERKRTLRGIFRDPQKERYIIDYLLCHNNAVADTAICFCKAVKESWPRPIVTGIFHGYFFNLFGRSAVGGHIAVDKILSSPYIDYLSAPQSYDKMHRRMGGSGQSRGLVESCRLNGKLWLDEMDQATHKDKMREGYTDLVTYNVSDDISIVRRNMIQPFTRGMGMWFYDFGPTNVSGWWEDPTLLSDIRSVYNIICEYYKKPYIPQGDVLIVYDDKVFTALANDYVSDPITDPLCVNQASIAVFHCGVMADTVYLSDIDKVDFNRYRTVIMANVFQLTEHQRHLIKTKVLSGGRHIVWYYASGYSTGEKLDASNISDICGINVEESESPASPTMTIDFCSVMQVQEAPQTIEIQYDSLKDKTKGDIYPFFTIADSHAVVCGRDKHSGKAMLACKDMGSWYSWYASLPITDWKAIKGIIALSRAHIYVEGGDVAHAGNGIVMVHTETGGQRTIKLRNGITIQAILEARSTALFDSTTGQRLL